MLNLIFDTYPELRSGKVRLRQLLMSDAADILQMRTEIDAQRHLKLSYFRRTPGQVRENLVQLIEGVKAADLIVWGITLPESDRVIGTLGFHKIQKDNCRAEIGYMISPMYWGKGLVSEGVSLILEYGFKVMNLHSIEAHVSPENQRSISLLDRFNFVKEGYFRENYFFDGEFTDTVVFSLLQKDYLNAQVSIQNQ